VVYETADPGKFPNDIEKAIDITPEIPEGIRRQQGLEERIYQIESPPSTDEGGNKRMGALQYEEVKEKITAIFSS